MRAFSFSIINGYVRGLGLKLLTFRRKESCLTLLSFRSLSVPCPSFVEDDECSTSEDSGTESLSSLKPEQISAEAGRQKICTFSGERSKGFVVGRKVSDSSKRKRSVVQRMAWILVHWGQNASLSKQQEFDRDYSDKARILKDEVALYLLRWFDHSKGSKFAIRSVCNMINISALYNMKGITMNFIRYLARDNFVEEESHNMVFDVLGESCKDRIILETVYSMLVYSYIEREMVEVPLELICRMNLLNFLPSVMVVRKLIQILLESKQMDLAWDLVIEMQNHGMHFGPDTFSSFIHEYCIEGSLACACKLLFEMKNYCCKPDVVAYTIVVNTLCKWCLLKEATSLLYKAIQGGLSLDSISVSPVVDGYCKAGRILEARNLLKASGCTPDTFVYNSFISKLCRDGNVIEAVELFDEMIMFGLLPDCFCYTTIIKGYCKVQNILRALKYFGEMLKKGLKPVVATYTALIDGHCKVGDLQGAESLFLQMIKGGLKPDIVAYNVLIDGHTKKAHMDEAVKWLDRMRMDDVSPDVATYNILIHGLIKRGFVKKSLEIFHKLIQQGPSPDKFTYTSAIVGLSKVGNLKDAYLIWDDMRERRMRPDTIAGSALLNGYCKAGRVQEADTLFQKMLDTGLKPGIILYNTLVHGFCSKGNTHDACRLVNMMAANGIIPNNSTYRALVHGYEKNGFGNALENAAIKIHQLLKKNGIDVDKSQYENMFSLEDKGCS